MQQATIELSDELMAAIEAYRRDHPEAGGVPELAEHLIEDFLRVRGYLEPYIALSIPVGPPGSAEPEDSAEHDRVSVEAWMKRRSDESS